MHMCPRPDLTVMGGSSISRDTQLKNCGSIPYDKPELRSGPGHSGCVGEGGIEARRRRGWRRRKVWSDEGGGAHGGAVGRPSRRLTVRVMAVRQRRSGEGWGRGGARGYRPRARQNLPARGEPGLGHTDAGRRVNVRVECGMCLADWGRALAGCGAQVGAPGPSCRPACNARPTDTLLEQQPGGGRLPAARPPPGDYPGPRRRCAGGGPCGPAGDSRAHRPVWLIQFLCSRPSFTPLRTRCLQRPVGKTGYDRIAMNRRRTAGPYRYEPFTHGVHPAPRSLASSLNTGPEGRRPALGRRARPREACTKNEGERDVRAMACGERARGCSPIVCSQPLPVARVHRTTPRRKPVRDCYLPKSGR